jgi:predicted aminopeptidase
MLGLMFGASRPVRARATSAGVTPALSATCGSHVAFALAALATISACMPIRYVTQASAGQEQLLRRAVPLETAQQASHIKPEVRALLRRIPEIKAFGERNGLKPTENYTTYSELFRPEVLWVVSASEPLRFRPRTWRFPVVGSFTYLGWFGRADADGFARDLRADGLDVDVRPSHAYSTLGWFKDPVVSTMIDQGPEALGELADVVLHESLHATFYVAGQSTLNESVAKFVGDTLALRYLDQTLGADTFERVRYVDARREEESRGMAMREAYTSLEALYASRQSTATKSAEKSRLLRELRIRSQLRRAPNNATLIQYKTYGSGQEQMEHMLALCNNSFPRFLRTLETERTRFEAAEAHAEPGALLAKIAACLP